jgi:uncharacterized protein YdeI (YjbR/CyaY-like superfamily)
MGKKDVRVGAYIEKSAPFARPILKHIRKLVHQACPEVEETIKWGMPFFEYKGILCFMASFKAHCAFGVWHGKQLVKDRPELVAKNEKGMGQLGRILSTKDLPPDKVIIALVRSTMKLRDASVKSAARSRATTSRAAIVPDYIMAAIRKNKKAQATFESFSPSHKREYVSWIIGAKREETRQRRLAQAVVWMAEGKSQDRKYERK